MCTWFSDAISNVVYKLTYNVLCPDGIPLLPEIAATYLELDWKS
jgi:hypothetical protein